MKMDAPRSVSDLRRLLGMVNHLGKFSPRLADICQPMRGLLSAKNSWLWGPTQERAFANLKEELTQYDTAAKSKISADASSFGLGAVLLQQKQEGWKPVAYASRSLTETERRYMLRLRKRHWLLHGPVRSSLITYWGNTSNSRLITNLLSLSLATNSSPSYSLVQATIGQVRLYIQSSMREGALYHRQPLESSSR